MYVIHVGLKYGWQNIKINTLQECKVGAKLKLNYFKKVFFFLIHLFARDILLMKKLEIEETKTT